MGICKFDPEPDPHFQFLCEHGARERTFAKYFSTSSDGTGRSFFERLGLNINCYNSYSRFFEILRKFPL